MKAQKNQETLTQHATAEDAAALQSSKSVEGSKILYILVQDDPEPGAKEGEQGPCHRYTRPLLTSTLQLMGCKPRHAIKVCMIAYVLVLDEKSIVLHFSNFFGIFKWLSILSLLGVLCSLTLRFYLIINGFDSGRLATVFSK